VEGQGIRSRIREVRREGEEGKEEEENEKRGKGEERKWSPSSLRTWLRPWHAPRNATDKSLRY